MGEIERVSDQSLATLPKNEIFRVFPKQVSGSKSSLILKGPKTEGSYRKQYLPAPLLVEIKERIEQIQKHMEFYGEEYQDYGLLTCHPDGRPFDPKSFNKMFKEQQRQMQIEEQDQIEFQELRKSGQMHKVRLTKNNYQLVAENNGQSPEVLMSNYNEALEEEKRALAVMIEQSFYPRKENADPHSGDQVSSVLQMIQSDPEITRQVLQALLLGVVHAQADNTF